MQHSLDTYLQHCRVAKRLSARIVDIYAKALEKLAQLCEANTVTLLDVQHHHIRRWMASGHAQGLAPGTMALQLSSWRGYYKWLIANGHIQHNPCADVRAPKAAKPLPKALGVDAAVALASFDPPLRSRGDVAKRQGGSSEAYERQTTLIVELLYGCGLRVSELVGLDVAASATAMTAGRGWIDGDAREVHVFGKGSKRRMVPLGSQAALALNDYLTERQKNQTSDPLEPALLLGYRGKRLTRQAAWALVRARSLAAGLDTPVHPHMLRHSFASHVLQSSSDLRAVQELLGHSSIASTQVYTRLDFQHLAKIYDNTHPRAKLQKGTS